MSKEQQQRWRDLNRDYVRQREHEYAQSNPKKLLLIGSKATAKRRGLEYNITEEDLEIPTHCPLLGIPLTKIRGSGRVKSNLSIDRINSDLGYVKGNVWIISDLANRMKSNATNAELLQFAKGILKVYATSDSKDTP